MKQSIQIITILLLLSVMGLSGCDQAKDLATQAAEKAKQDVVSEIGKAVNGGEDRDKMDVGQSNKETDIEEDEEK